MQASSSAGSRQRVWTFMTKCDVAMRIRRRVGCDPAHGAADMADEDLAFRRRAGRATASISDVDRRRRELEKSWLFQ